MKDCGERQNNEVSDGSDYTGRQDIPTVTVVVQQQQDDMMMVINTGASYVTNCLEITPCKDANFSDAKTSIE